MRTIEQLKQEATALIVSSPKRGMTLTGEEFAELVEFTADAQQSQISGVPELHSKLQSVIGKVANTVPIKIPASEVLVLTSLGG